MTAIIIILITLLELSALFLAYRFGYEKGVHDLTQEIDEGIKRIKDEKQTEYESIREQDERT